MIRNETATISDTVKDFLSQLAGNKQSNTIQSYSVALRRFQQFLVNSQNLFGNSPVTELTVDHAIDYGKSLQDQAPATIRNYLAALAQFYRYLFAHYSTRLDVADSERLFAALKRIRPQAKSLPHIPTDGVIDALIKVAGDDSEQPRRKQSSGDKERAKLQRLRNIALLLALKSSGMRLGETLSLQCGDLDYRKKSAIVTGKAHKQRVVYFDDSAWKAMLEYLRARQGGDAQLRHGVGLADLDRQGRRQHA